MRTARRFAPALLAFVALLTIGAPARAQLVPLGTGEGGEIRDLVRTAEGTVYAAAARGGVFRSTDGGLTWGVFRAGMDRMSANALALGPDGSVYAAGGRYTTPTHADGHGALYRLAPGATTWADVSGTLAGLGGLAGFAVAAVSPDVLLVGTVAGVYRSADGGGTWALVPDVPGPVWELFRASDGAVYLGAHHDVPVRRSDDGGLTWVPVSAGLPGGPRTYVFEEAADGTIVTAPAQYYYSTDRGATWQTAAHAFPGGSTGFARAPDGTLYAADGSSAVRSADHGRSWQYEGLTAPGVYFHVGDLVVAPDGELLLGTRYGGVIRSDHPAGTWRFANAGLTAARIHDAATGPGGALVAVGDGDVFTSADGGQTWAGRSTGGLLHYSVAATAAVALAGERNSRVYRVFPDGTTDAIALMNAAGQVQALLALPSGRFVAVLGRRVFVSDDAGATWAQTFNQGETGRALERGGDGALYLVRDDGLWRSADDGGTWTQVTEDYGLGTAISGMAVAADAAGRIFVGLGSAVLRSADGGATWAYTIDYSLGGVAALHIGADGTLWVGAFGGLFRSTDGGVTFEDRSAGLYDPSVVDILPAPPTAFGGGVEFVVVTEGGGSFGYDPSATATEPAPRAPALALRAAPNPTGGRTAVVLDLGEAAEVRVGVYDALGRRVASLYDGPLAAGAHALELDVRVLPPGVYVLRSTAGGRSAATRFTVAR